jgi:hypothetical protein
VKRTHGERKRKGRERKREREKDVLSLEEIYGCLLKKRDINRKQKKCT